MALIRCLNEAIAELERTDLIDDSTRQTLVESLRSVVNDTTMTDAQKRVRLAQMARHQRRSLFRAQVTKKVDEATIERIDNWLQTFPEDQRGTVLRNWVENDASYGATIRESVSAKARAIESATLGQLNDIFHRITDRRVPWAKDSAYAKIFNQELRGMDTGNAQAKADVQKFREVVFPLLKQIQEDGVYVGVLENWAPQGHSASRIINDRAGWTEFMMRNLDPERHPDSEATAEHIWRTIQTRHLEDPDGASISMAREVFFKTPEAEVEYFYRFGDGHLGESLHHAVRALARKSVLAKEFGPSSQKNMNLQIERIKKQATLRAAEERAAGNKKIAKHWENEAKQAERAEWIVASETGGLQTPANMKIANVMGATRQWMVTQFLGFVATMIVTQDSVVSMFATRFHTGGFARAVGEQINNFRLVIGNDTARHWAEEMGVWTHFLHAAAADRFSTPFAATERLRGISGQAATATQRLAGTYFLERALRSATMMTISRSLGRMSKLDWLDLHPKYRKVLEANGWSQGKWKQFRNVVKLDETLGTVDVMNLPQDLREATLAYFYRETDLAVVYPQHYDRALLVLGGRAGTAPGELVATATQFWSWPIAFMRGPMRRELAMGGTGFVGFAAGMMASGALSTQMYAVLKNEPTFEWDSPTLWVRSALRSGLFTPLGDLAVQATRYGGTDIGPLGRQFDNITSTLGKAGMDIITGDAEQIARPVAQLARDLVIPNLWWTEYSLTSRAMDHIMWELDPKYMRSRERRWRNEGRRN